MFNDTSTSCSVQNHIELLLKIRRLLESESYTKTSNGIYSFYESKTTSSVMKEVKEVKLPHSFYLIKLMSV